MTQNQINNHRAILPLPFDQITAYSSFAQVLGNKIEDYTEEERKERWAKCMGKLEELDKDLANMWMYKSSEGCDGCKYRNTMGIHWCRQQGLPCNYNPVLQDYGMACCGFGFTKN